MTFSKLVKEVRKELNISQKQLAKILNVSFASINRWENGKTEPNKLTKKVFYDYCIENEVDSNLIEEIKNYNLELD